MTIGELARSAAVRISTLRFYERRGLLRPTARTAAGYRVFSAEDVARVRFLRRAQELGFGLAELAQMLALSHQRTVRRRDLAAVGATKLAELDQRIADLRRMRRAVAGLLSQPCIDPEAPCPIVASLAELRAPRMRSTTRASGRAGAFERASRARRMPATPQPVRP
jgi:MerR family mercuric resistance operon transcriptional regulator